MSKLTRPKFLMKFITDSSGALLSTDQLADIIPDSEALMYCAYNILREYEDKGKYKPYIDGESHRISVRYKSDDIPEDIIASYDNEPFVMGRQLYEALLEADGRYLHIKCRIVD